jgi:hypothetical protein
VSKEWELTDDEILVAFNGAKDSNEYTWNHHLRDISLAAQKKLWGYILNNIPLLQTGDNTKLLELNRSFDF